MGGDAITDLAEGAAGAVVTDGESFGGVGLIRKLHATVIAWEK